MSQVRIRTSLLRWYDANKRDLPWRSRSDPYAVLVSEVMLQQTTVAAVAPYYERWMRRFPEIGSLARAREATVLACWQGLGYYRRARNLHAAARIVASSGWPEDLRVLPGVGEYTAGAVGSIAFGRQVAAVDGNVERVFARVNRRSLVDRGEVRDWATSLVAKGRAGDVNQALMDLGATVCRPSNPDCGACPIRRHCASSGDAANYPTPRLHAPEVRLVVHVTVPYRQGLFGVKRFEVGEWWEGLFGFPRGSSSGKEVGRLSHTVTNHKLDLRVHLSSRAKDVEWKSASQLRRLAMPSPDRKILAMALQEIGSNPRGTAKDPSSAKK